MKKTETKLTAEEIVTLVKKQGLSIRYVIDSRDIKETQEPCEYQECKNPVVFLMEGLFVCEEHAITLMKCFLPKKDNQNS